jgi:hypothetical protein
MYLKIMYTIEQLEVWAYSAYSQHSVWVYWFFRGIPLTNVDWRVRNEYINYLLIFYLKAASKSVHVVLLWILIEHNINILWSHISTDKFHKSGVFSLDHYVDLLFIGRKDLYLHFPELL